MRKLLLGGAAMLAFALTSTANAAVIFLESVTPAGGGNNFFSYRIEFSDDEGITNGSRLVILDFAGYVDGSITAGGAAGINAFAENTTSALIGVPGLSDDAGVANLVFTYNGPTIDLGGTQFSGFGAESIFSLTRFDGFQSVTVKTGGEANGSLVFTQGTVGVPAIPEPATWAMMIGGFGLVGGALRRRRSLSFA